jgi:hypothetical protein
MEEISLNRPQRQPLEGILPVEYCVHGAPVVTIAESDAPSRDRGRNGDNDHLGGGNGRYRPVNRDETVEALTAQPFGTDVQVNVGGFYLDVAAIRFDERRHAIIIELFDEDAEQAMRHFLRADPLG